MGVLIEQVSPNGNLQAVVEDDGRVVYFYLCGEEGSGWGMKVCWVRNRVQAPSDLDVESMKSGAPPVPCTIRRPAALLRLSE